MKEIKDAFKRWSDFKGRSTRKQFWFFYGFYILAIMVTSFLGKVGENIISPILALVLFVPFLALAVRRIHDSNKSGWFILIPFYNLYLYCLPGDTGANRFGNPVGQQTEGAIIASNPTAQEQTSVANTVNTETKTEDTNN